MGQCFGHSNRSRSRVQPVDFDLATRRANNAWTKIEDSNNIKQVDQIKNNKDVDVKDDIKNVSDYSSYLLSIEDIDGDVSVDTKRKLSYI